VGQVVVMASVNPTPAMLLLDMWARVRAWWDRPVKDRWPLLMPRPPREADTYGRHDRSVGEQTIPLAELLTQLGHVPAPRARREPPLYGTEPLHLWTHPERYPTVPQRPPGECPLWPCSVPTVHHIPDFDDTEVSA
jgi:hypothetical protein